jgi:hypothetical protein
MERGREKERDWEGGKRGLITSMKLGRGDTAHVSKCDLMLEVCKCTGIPRTRGGRENR